MEYHYYMLDGVLIEIQIETRSTWNRQERDDKYDKKYD
jgi:hypothetical protein